MIITRTPFRASLFGGSTDYKSYYEDFGSLLIGFTINKYCYITARYTPEIMDYYTRICYSQIETADDNENIKHNGVRGVLEYLKITEGVDISHFSDLPAQTGIGSSSSFIVGLLKAFMALTVKYWEPHTFLTTLQSKKILAETAIHIERELLKESGGIQDQIWAVYGGFNSINIDDTGFHVRPMPLSLEFLDTFRSHSLLIYTGRSRQSFKIAQSHDSKSSEIHKHAIKDLAEDAYYAFKNEDIYVLGTLLHQSWLAKKSISPLVSSDPVDQMYNDLQSNGMIGGKLLGSGGSGFIFGLFDSEDKRNKMANRYAHLNIDYDFDMKGSSVVNG